jgi:putative transposase
MAIRQQLKKAFLYMIVIKCVKQKYTPNDRILDLMETFRKMVNDCIRIGLENNESAFISLQKLCYHNVLRKYDDILSHYKLCAIKRAAGILSNRRKSIKRGFKTKNPFTRKPQLVWCLLPKVIRELAIIRIPLGNRQYFDIPLTRYTQNILFESDLRIHSFTLGFNNTVSIAYSKNVEEIECNEASGIDRNVDNITYGDNAMIVQYDLSKATKIAVNTKKIFSSFRRNDRRIGKRIFSKYGRRRKNRVSQLLHGVSKHIVTTARENRHAIVFEDIRDIRKLHSKGNGQGRNYRGKMNSWPYGEIKRQIQYKAQWSGIPIIQLTKDETYGTSILCGICGKRTRTYEGVKKDSKRKRLLYCENCDRWIDRDVNAVINQSIRGLQRLCRSKGLPSEAMVPERGRKEPLIRKVDGSKLMQAISAMRITKPNGSVLDDMKQIS